MRSGNVLSVSLLAAALTTAFAAPGSANIVVNIDKSMQSMTVSVDGSYRYTWPVSTGRPGYDTPNGTFKPNRMDADHMSQEWDNAPMPHAIFFDLNGHAIHGFLDVRHLGSAVSHGCVRLAPQHAALLYSLISQEGMNETTVVISGRTPAGRMPEVARRSAPTEENYGQPVVIVPGYAQQQPAPYDGQAYYRQPQPYGQAQPYYLLPYRGQRSYYGQPGYVQPRYYVIQPYGLY